MAGQIIISNIKTDSDNTFSILANTGTVIFSANIANGITTNIANTRITGNIVSSQITSVANTQITGTITAGQLATSLNLATNNVQVASVQTATGTQAITFAANGWTGVGTTSPAARLHVYGDNNNQFKVQSSGAEANFTLAGTSYGQINNTTGDFYITNDGAGGSVYLRTASTTQVEVTADGKFKCNSGYGSVATAYGCRAWVAFNGTGTIAIRASGNISSLTDYGVGDYFTAFSSNLVDTNYCVVGGAVKSGGGPSGTNSGVVTMGESPALNGTGIGVLTVDGSAVDRAYVYAAFFR